MAVALIIVGLVVLVLTFIEGVLGATGFWERTVSSATEDRMLAAAVVQLGAGAGLMFSGLTFTL